MKFEILKILLFQLLKLAAILLKLSYTERTILALGLVGKAGRCQRKPPYHQHLAAQTNHTNPIVQVRHLSLKLRVYSSGNWSKTESDDDSGGDYDEDDGGGDYVDDDGGDYDDDYDDDIAEM